MGSRKKTTWVIKIRVLRKDIENNLAALEAEDNISIPLNGAERWYTLAGDTLHWFKNRFAIATIIYIFNTIAIIFTWPYT